MKNKPKNLTSEDEKIWENYSQSVSKIIQKKKITKQSKKIILENGFGLENKQNYLNRTSNKKVASRISRLRQYGWNENKISEEPGFNSRLDEVQAAVLRVKLPHLDKDTDKRILIAQKYNESFLDIPMISPIVRNQCRHVYHLYVVAVDKRDELVQFLKKRGVLAGIHYQTPVHRMPAYTNCILSGGKLLQTEALVDRIISLPIYPELKKEEQDQVISVIREFYLQ